MMMSASRCLSCRPTSVIFASRLLPLVREAVVCSLYTALKFYMRTAYSFSASIKDYSLGWDM